MVMSLPWETQCSGPMFLFRIIEKLVLTLFDITRRGHSSTIASCGVGQSSDLLHRFTSSFATPTSFPFIYGSWFLEVIFSEVCCVQNSTPESDFQRDNLKQSFGKTKPNDEKEFLRKGKIFVTKTFSFLSWNPKKLLALRQKNKAVG